MSLLHSALKKAESEGSPREGEPTVLVEEGEPPRRISRRVVILSLFTALSLSVLAYKFLGPKFFPKNGTSRAEVALKTEAIQSSSPEELMKEAMTFVAKEQYELAKEKLDKVIIFDPKNVEAYNNLGYVLRKMGKNEEAFNSYQRGLAINPQCIECLNNLGVVYLNQGDLPEAETQFQKAINLKNDYAQPYFHLALLQEAKGDWDEARKNYVKFTELAQNVRADFMLKIQQRITELGNP